MNTKGLGGWDYGLWKKQRLLRWRNIYNPKWSSPPPTKKTTRIFGVWQVGGEVGVIKWLKTSNDAWTPWYPKVCVARGKLHGFLLLRQQIYTGLTMLRFRKSLVYVNYVQLLIFSYFFVQCESIERHGWGKDNEFILHQFQDFLISVVHGKFYQH